MRVMHSTALRCPMHARRCPGRGGKSVLPRLSRRGRLAHVPALTPAAWARSAAALNCRCAAVSVHPTATGRTLTGDRSGRLRLNVGRDGSDRHSGGETRSWSRGVRVKAREVERRCARKAAAAAPLRRKPRLTDNQSEWPARRCPSARAHLGGLTLISGRSVARGRCHAAGTAGSTRASAGHQRGIRRGSLQRRGGSGWAPWAGCCCEAPAATLNNTWNIAGTKTDSGGSTG